MRKNILRTFERAKIYNNVLGQKWIKHFQVIERVKRGNSIKYELVYEIVETYSQDKHASYIGTLSLFGFLGIERWF